MAYLVNRFLTSKVKKKRVAQGGEDRMCLDSSYEGKAEVWSCPRRAGVFVSGLEQ